MGSGHRPPLSQVLETPGPGQYNDQKKKLKGPTIAGKEKMNMKPSPGPGDYTPIDGTVKKKAAKFSMGTQKKDLLPCKVNNDNPGAGSYHSGKRGKSGPGFGFGSQSRMKNYSKQTPGPGDYKIPTKIRDCGNYALNKNQFSYV